MRKITTNVQLYSRRERHCDFIRFMSIWKPQEKNWGFSNNEVVKLAKNENKLRDV